MTPAALARYRLRPVPWGWLAVLAAGWLLLTRLLVELPNDPGMGVTVFRWAALLLGLGGAVLAAPETDPPQDLLRAGPVPHWRTLALRLAGWLALGRRRSWPWRRCWTASPAGPPPTWPGGPCPASGWPPRPASWPPPGPRSWAAAPPPWPPRSGCPRPGGPGRPGSRSSSPASPATPLAVQPGLDGRAQPGPGGGGAWRWRRRTGLPRPPRRRRRLDVQPPSEVRARP